MTDIVNTNKQIADVDVINVLMNVFDPDIHFSVYEIGLIYNININDTNIDIVMTLTSVNCPEAQSIPEDIKSQLQEKFPQLIINVEITFEPMWTVDNMSDEIKLNLGLL